MNHQHQSTLIESDLLGIITHPGTANDYLNFVKSNVESDSRVSIYYHNLHTVYLYVTSDTFKTTYANKTVLMDGMGALFLYKLAGFALSRDYRVTYVDFIFPLLELARDQNWRVFHIGQEASAQQKALTIIEDRVPGIKIAGHHGYFDLSSNSTDTQDVVRCVNDFKTDLLLVGLGSPNQEFWVDNNRDNLNAPVVMTCGSCMDYIAGKVRAAPRWMGRAGIESVYRIYADPKRLAFRYLIEPILLFSALVRLWIERKRKSATP